MSLAKCPLCGSAPVEHPAEGLCAAGASCSNGNCILHEGYQDETNRHVLAEDWPSGDGMSIKAIHITMDYVKVRDLDGVHHFKFSVTRDNGETTTILVPCIAMSDIPSAVAQAVSDALAWNDALEREIKALRYLQRTA